MNRRAFLRAVLAIGGAAIAAPVLDLIPAAPTLTASGLAMALEQARGRMTQFYGVGDWYWYLHPSQYKAYCEVAGWKALKVYNANLPAGPRPERDRWLASYRAERIARRAA